MRRFFPSFQKALTMTNIETIRQSIASAEIELTEASKLAVSEATNPATLLKQAKLLLERREILKLLRAQLAQAERAEAAEQAAADQARRLAARKKVAEMAAKIVSEAEALSRELVSAAKRYHRICTDAQQMMTTAKSAADLDFETLKTMHPTQRPYALAINLIARHFGFGPGQTLDQWPAQYRVEAAAAAALSPFVQLADWPEAQEGEAPTEYVEATPEEIRNHAL